MSATWRTSNGRRPSPMRCGRSSRSGRRPNARAGFGEWARVVGPLLTIRRLTLPMQPFESLMEFDVSLPPALPPLVEPADSLTIEEVRRYSRHLIIPDVAMSGQKRLKNSRVLAIGAGGLGSPTLMYLAAAGVGTLGVIDYDTVDESNLQRQIIHGQSDIGRSKAQSARDSIKEINPLVNVVLHEERLENDNVFEIFSQ